MLLERFTSVIHFVNKTIEIHAAALAHSIVLAGLVSCADAVVGSPEGARVIAVPRAPAFSVVLYRKLIVCR